jgi:predicted nuclease of predicted toxin-antitoxin system
VSAIRLLLDEDVRPLLAEVLRERGFDVVAVVPEGLGESEDAEVLEHAIEHHRTLLTHNVEHFVELAAEYARKGWEHYGIIVAAQAPIRELLARVLRLLAQKQAEDMINALEWLHNYR